MDRIPRIATLVLALCLGAATGARAQGGGGGGVVVEGMYFPRYGDPQLPHESPGMLGCFGGVGQSYDATGLRFGGEGMYCWGEGPLSMVYGGGQFGVVRPLGRSGLLYWTAHMGLGAGSLVDRRLPVGGHYRSFFAYLKPTLAIGLPLGPTAVEVGLTAFTPVNLAQWVDATGPRGLVTPTAGLQITAFTGWFEAPRRWAVRDADALAVPGPDDAPTAPRPAPAPARPLPEDAPLAVPAGAWPDAGDGEDARREDGASGQTTSKGAEAGEASSGPPREEAPLAVPAGGERSGPGAEDGGAASDDGEGAGTDRSGTDGSGADGSDEGS